MAMVVVEATVVHAQGLLDAMVETVEKVVIPPMEKEVTVATVETAIPQMIAAHPEKVEAVEVVLKEMAKTGKMVSHDD